MIDDPDDFALFECNTWQCRVVTFRVYDPRNRSCPACNDPGVPPAD